MDRKDCFARYETSNNAVNCSALTYKKCNNCKFYRNDLSRADIEKDIKKYSSHRSIRNDEY